jgi:hypothetical protein
MLLRFLQRPLQCTVLQTVSTLILWLAAHVCGFLQRSFAVHFLCAGGQHSDPLAQLPMFFALAAFAAVRCVAEVSL